jgi:uncharacterized RDD family membrane protein YckC
MSVTTVPRQARSIQGRTAGIVSRTVAALIDLVVVVGSVAVLLFAWSALVFLVGRGRFELEGPEGVGTYLLGWAFAVLYLWITWWTTGRSVGAQVMGLRVVDGEGRRLGPARALLRALVATALPVGLLWSAVDRRHRSVADLIVRSLVVYDWEHRAPVHLEADQT